MTLNGEVALVAPGLDAAIAASIRKRTKLRGEGEFCRPGSVANDGQVVADARKYD